MKDMNVLTDDIQRLFIIWKYWPWQLHVRRHFGGKMRGIGNNKIDEQDKKNVKKSLTKKKEFNICCYYRLLSNTIGTTNKLVSTNLLRLNKWHAIYILFYFMDHMFDSLFFFVVLFEVRWWQNNLFACFRDFFGFFCHKRRDALQDKSRQSLKPFSEPRQP